MIHSVRNLLDIAMRNNMKKFEKEKKYWLLMESKQTFSLHQHIPMMKIL